MDVALLLFGKLTSSRHSSKWVTVKSVGQDLLPDATNGCGELVRRVKGLLEFLRVGRLMMQQRLQP